jgi:hypothetical protein
MPGNIKELTAGYVEALEIQAKIKDERKYNLGVLATGYHHLLQEPAIGLWPPSNPNRPRFNRGASQKRATT